jgi:hypothetical protein
MFWKNNLGWYGKQLNKHISSLQAGKYGAIPWIFCVFAESDAKSKSVAARALYAALETMTFDGLVRVDEQMRQITSMEWSISWRDYSLDNFFTAGMSEAERRAVVVFASFNPNGYIREKAVRLMKSYAGTLPFAILRQNDWVSQVRIAAGDTADYRLQHLSQGELIAALPFADKLGRSGRTQSGNTYIKRIYNVLTSKLGEYDLNVGLNSNNIHTRRICINALFKSGSIRYDLAFEQLKIESDPFLRAGIFRRLVSAGQNMESVIDRFLKDKYPLNRLLAFQYISETDQSKALQVAKQLLLDKSAAVRESARDIINGVVLDFDCRAFYISNITVKTAPAILGIGETGVADNTDIIDEYLKSLPIAVTCAAMTAVMRLDGKKYAAVITEFLKDGRAGIVKTARNLILKSYSPDYMRILEIFRTTSYVNTKQKCFSILLTASKWQRLIYILEALNSDGGSILEKAEDALARWIGNYNRSYIAATRVQIDTFTKSMEDLGGKLSPKTKQQILFLLR